MTPICAEIRNASGEALTLQADDFEVELFTDTFWDGNLNQPELSRTGHVTFTVIGPDVADTALELQQYCNVDASPIIPSGRYEIRLLRGEADTRISFHECALTSMFVGGGHFFDDDMNGAVELEVDFYFTNAIGSPADPKLPQREKLDWKKLGF